MGSIPGSGRSPGQENGSQLQYSCLENPVDGEAWQATVHGVAKSQTRLSDFTFLFTFQYSCQGSQGQRSLVGYGSWGSQRVGHDLETKQHQQVTCYI